MQTTSPFVAFGNISGSRKLRLGIMSALAEEQAGVLSLMTQRHTESLGRRAFHLGQFDNAPNDSVEAVCVLSGIGKVAAAAAATSLILRFGCTHLLFTGVAGGLGHLGQGVKVGDVVIAAQFVQHDMNASPLFPRFELPLYGTAVLNADAALTQVLRVACAHALPLVMQHESVRALLHETPCVHEGLIASGDRFVSTAQEASALLQALSAAQLQPLCVEMEGAAVAQVCHDFAVPFAALRVISDRADDAAHVDFTRFVNSVASPYVGAILRECFSVLSESK